MPVRRVFFVILLGAGCVVAQEPTEKTGARELYYFYRAPKEKLPPVRKPAASPAPTAAKASTAAQQVPAPAASPIRQGDAAIVPVSSTGANVLNLGLRYNLILVDATSGKAAAVDPDRTFRKGECFAIDFEANRAGYLYVLAKQSSGNWRPLLPSPEMADEANMVNPGEKIRVPSQYCFEIGDPPGTETLFVVLSRDPGDVYQLHQGIKGIAEPAPAAKPAPRPELTQLAALRNVDHEVERMSEQLGSRDMLIRKTSQPTSAQETPFSVYVVNASLTPSSRVVAQIEIRHR
jgi:hypothetical protein